jgi:hypothetical protein
MLKGPLQMAARLESLPFFEVAQGRLSGMCDLNKAFRAGADPVEDGGQRTLALSTFLRLDPHR